MPVQPDKLPVGATGENLDTVAVTTTAGVGLHREVVALADPEFADAIARVTNDEPAVDEMGVVVRQTSKPAQTATALGTASGTTVIVTPASGNKIRLYWYSLQARPTNSAMVTAGLRFGAAGKNIHTHELSQYGGLFAHSFKAADGYVEGAVNEAIYISQDAAQPVRANIDYEEVTP